VVDGRNQEGRKGSRRSSEPIDQRARCDKVSALRTEDYFAERAAEGNSKKALRVLKRAGRGNTPVSGDERFRK
jgi:hypothetical protein